MAQSGAKAWNPGLGAVNQDMVLLALDSEEAERILDALSSVPVVWQEYQHGEAVLAFMRLLEHLSDQDSNLTSDALGESERS